MHSKAVSRRNFLKLAGVAGVGAGLAACSGTAAPAPVVETVTGENGHTTTGAATANSKSAEEMDRLHEEGVQKFVDGIGKDSNFWRKPLAYTMEDGYKTFELSCEDIQWEVESGKLVRAMAYNGMVPGPEIRVTEGDQVRIRVTNRMEESTAVHWHGILLPNSMDGVPYLTQPPIRTGETFVYEFTARNPGSHMYHSHHNAAIQVTRGLLGAFIIEPKDKGHDPDYDSEYTIILNDTAVGLTLNGKSFPDTQPILAKLGEKIRIRYMNEGLLIHPMHLHGLEQLVFAKDGWNLPQPYYCDTLNITPGERYDVLVDCHTPGLWAFHCHVLSHVESAHGMFGMVTVLIVE
jgi:manganese oxidase